MPGDPGRAEEIGVGQGAFSPSTAELFRISLGHSDSLAFRSKIVLRIEQLERETEALKRLHNESAPFCRLPFEILSQIFFFLLSLCRQKHRDDISWTRVTRVCRRWREVSLLCPGLWSKLPLAHPVALRTFLERSKNLPISIEFYHAGDSESGRALEGALASDAHRLTDLNLSSDTYRAFEESLSQVTCRAPLLKMLKIENTNEDTLPPDFLRGGAPSLTHLHIDGCEFSWGNLPICRNLVRLHLQVDEDSTRRPSYTAFIHSLRPLSALQDLFLGGVLPDPVDLPTDTPLAFPAVTSLSVSDYTQRVQQFLEVTSFPAVLDVKFTLEDEDEHALGRIFTAFKHSCRDPCNRVLDGKIVAFKFIDHGVVIGPEVALHFGKRAPLSLCVWFTDWEPTLQNLYSLLQVHFDWTPLCKLEIGGQLTLGTREWQAMFGNLPKLRRVVLSGNRNSTFIALLQTLKSDRLGDSEDGHDQVATPWFPALKTIIRNGAEFQSKDMGKDKKVLVKRLAEAVNHRSEDRPPLKLGILQCHNFTSQDEALIQASIPKLELVWDGWVPPLHGSSSSSSGWSSGGELEIAESDS